MALLDSDLPRLFRRGFFVMTRTRQLIQVIAAGVQTRRVTLGVAQVYLTNINDLPEFMDVWNSHFADSPCALTVVATKGLALLESIIEINIFGVRHSGKIKKQIIDHKASAAMRLGPAGVRAGDLLCLSAIAGIQISNWVIVLGAIIVILYHFHIRMT